MSARIAAVCLVLLGLSAGCSPPGDADAGDGGWVIGEDGRGDAPTLDVPLPPADAPLPPSDAPPADAPPTDPLDGVGTAELLGSGFMFLEGPQWIEATGELVFSDIPASTIHVVRAGGAIEVFRMPSGSSNGLAMDPDGCLLAGEHSGRRVSRACPPTAVATTVVSTFEGSPLNSPNDLVVRSDGTIYFTDPPYGLGGTPSALGFMGLFRIAPSGTLVVEVRGPPSARPNGVALSPDERVLYGGDSEADRVRASDVAVDGSLSGERTFVASVPTPDGMAVDVAGNLFVAAADGVRVYAPDGTPWGTLDVPMQPANCAFGGADHRTLFVTARTALYRVTGLGIAGIP